MDNWHGEKNHSASSDSSPLLLKLLSVFTLRYSRKFQIDKIYTMDMKNGKGILLLRKNIAILKT